MINSIIVNVTDAQIIPIIVKLITEPDSAPIRTPLLRSESVPRV